MRKNLMSTLLRSKMKNKIVNFFTLIVIVYFVYQTYTRYNHSNKFIGKAIPTQTIQDLKSHQIPEQQKLVFVNQFCGPCKLEMYKLTKLMESNPGLAREYTFIHMGQYDQNIHKFKNILPERVRFIMSDLLARQLGVYATPTTIAIEDNVISDYSTGIQLSIW